MPRIRSRAARGLSEDQHGMLMGGMYVLLGPVDPALFHVSEAERIAYLFGSEAGMREIWRIFRHQLIAECVDQHGPSTRPAAWWRFDSPSAPRKEPSLDEQRRLLEQWNLIGPNERKRLQATHRARPDPDLEPVN
jgi:hypothetical protein